MNEDRPAGLPSGSLSPFGKEPRGRELVVFVGLGLSFALHAVAGVAILTNPGRAAKAAQWVEMSVAPAPPLPPPPPPPPPPEKPKAKPKVEPVKFKDIPLTPPPPIDAPVDATPKPVRRLTQGLSASSFATGSGTGLDVRAGNSTAVAADGRGLSLDEASAPRSLASVTTPPVCNRRPMMDVPKEAQEAGVEGEIRVSFDVAPSGEVVRVRVLHDLGHGTGDACATAWKQVKCVPGKQDGVPVAVTGVPQVCTVRIEQ